MFDKRVLRTLKTAATFFFFSTCIFSSALKAQHGGDPGGRGRPGMMSPEMMQERYREKKDFERLCAYLELEKKQRKAAGKLFDKMQKASEKLAGDLLREELSPNEASGRRIKIYKDFQDKFKALLSEEQRKKYEQLRETGLKTEK
ncbi:MAG: hypothetical protein JXQ83_03065 [Candidatus Glassbacteria bacterium]|nr:hypothetical protein [Candidatus Glassbacteria bacterium]